MFDWIFRKINEFCEPTFEECVQGASQGEPRAQYYLSEHYHSGTRVPQDYKRARELLSASALGGYPAAQVILSGWYQDGVVGFTQDLVLAYAWNGVAALSSNRFWQSRAIENRRELEQKMSVEDIERAQELTRKFLEEIESSENRWVE